MSVDLQVDQALVLKKRARRRLVGAIALVLLMLIVLPQVLQDRSAQTAPESIKITMPAVEQEHAQVETVDAPIAEVVGQANSDAQELTAQESTDSLNVNKTHVEIAPALKEIEEKENARREALAKVAKTETAPVPKVETKKAESVNLIKSNEKAPAIATSPAVVKTVEDQATSKPEASSFTVQVGVYSDVANVKRLQDQLKQAGFVTTTEKTTTPKGDGLRLKAGKFTSRQDAMNALAKIKEIGLSGIVISND